MPKSTCIIDGCEAPSRSRGMCKPHYRKDYYQRNKAHENATNKAYLEARPEYQKARFKAWYEDTHGEAIAERRAALEARLADPNKTCTKCAETKPKLEFHIHKQVRDGRHSWCKACFYLHCKENEDQDARRERERRYRADPDKRRAMLAKHRKWYAANYTPERSREAVARAKRWAEDNPERATINSREASNRRRVRLRYQLEGDVSYSAILERDGMTCHLCLEEIPNLDDLHMDHVIPLSKGGPHSEDNIKPAHASCNLRKGARLVA